MVDIVPPAVGEPVGAWFDDVTAAVNQLQTRTIVDLRYNHSGLTTSFGSGGANLGSPYSVTLTAGHVYSVEVIGVMTLSATNQVGVLYVKSPLVGPADISFGNTSGNTASGEGYHRRAYFRRSSATASVNFQWYGITSGGTASMATNAALIIRDEGPVSGITGASSLPAS